MSSVESAAAEMWKTLCEELSRSMVDLVLAEAKRNGIADAEAARSLLSFATEMEREAQAILDQVGGPKS
ncbi:MAG: hypothetical protein LCH69_10040 [Proteobacteria bacterium]|nr:hypothetical protein [Pseudomonadota bacterium]